jgi:hypothetical protein
LQFEVCGNGSNHTELDLRIRWDRMKFEYRLIVLSSEFFSLRSISWTHEYSIKEWKLIIFVSLYKDVTLATST